MSLSTKTSAARHTTKLVIFLVDDESVLLDLAEASLEPGGFKIQKFSDPETALKKFKAAKPRPALVISDYAMGKMNGIQLLCACKKADPRVKTMLVSGTAGPEVVLDSPIKIDRYLSKPYQPSTLRMVVERLLEEES